MRVQPPLFLLCLLLFVLISCTKLSKPTNILETAVLTGTPTIAAIIQPLSTATTIQPTAVPTAANFTGHIAYSRGDNIWVMNANGTEQTELTHEGLGDFDPSWSPDGKQIAFRRASAEPGGREGIMVVNVDGSGEYKLTHGYLAGFPVWSPDGERIAFAGGNGIYLVNRDGTGLINLKAEGEYPAWSPDGTRIAFSARRDGNDEIYVMDADGSNQINLTHSPGDDKFPAWSPDGSKIIFSSYVSSNNEEIFVMNADGSAKIQLTFTPYQEEFPIWIPDGRIAFCADIDRARPSYYLINPDGSELVEITPIREARATCPIDWLP